MQYLVKAFKVLSDETRLRILSLLMERECCVCEVMQALDISQSRASRNLGILKDAGFIKSKRDGLWVVYSIDEERVNKHLIEIIKDALEGNEVAALDRERLKTATRVGLGSMQRARRYRGQDEQHSAKNRSW